jgi:predicted acylesterase/phospholipase RssA
LTGMTWTQERPFQTLALTGGGYRGLFTARVLDVIEEAIGDPIGRRFDLICGTSIGGIVALAVAFEVPMKDVVRVFLEDGQHIFPPYTKPTNTFDRLRDTWSHWRRPRYSVEPLRAAISRLIDPAATLADAMHPVAIPAVNVTQGRPQVFKTRHKEAWQRDSKFRAVDVGVATAAAPTFFELAEVGGSLFADGGLYANAPDLLVAHEAEHFFGVPPERQRLLSVGTTTRSYSVSFAAGRKFGIGDWIEDERLFSVMISSQQQFVEQLIKHRFGTRYCRIDHEPSQEQALDLGLDRASETAKKTLIGLASKAASDLLGTELAPFLSHHPQLKIFKG